MSEAAVVLLSGGLDSTTTLALAVAQGRRVYALSFSYQQRHDVELACAKSQARRYGVVAHEIVGLESFGRLVAGPSSLIASSGLSVPKDRDVAHARGIPSTYVPGRNTVFLSVALAWAEVVSAREIWLGVNAYDYSGYPDCRPEYLRAYEAMANLGTRAGVQGERLRVIAPLLNLRKYEIIARGVELDVDYADTVSCYEARADPKGAVLACGRCDSCQLRRTGFAKANVPDPTRYREPA